MPPTGDAAREDGQPQGPRVDGAHMDVLAENIEEDLEERACSSSGRDGRAKPNGYEFDKDVITDADYYKDVALKHARGARARGGGFGKRRGRGSRALVSSTERSAREGVVGREIPNRRPRLRGPDQRAGRWAAHHGDGAGRRHAIPAHHRPRVELMFAIGSSAFCRVLGTPRCPRRSRRSTSSSCTRLRSPPPGALSAAAWRFIASRSLSPSSAAPVAASSPYRRP